jgi:hypothetical protein
VGVQRIKSRDLLRELPGGADADGLGDLAVGVDAAEHAEDEAGGLAGAVVRLRDEVPVWRREDHGERDGLDLAGAAEPHLVVQPLEQLGGELHVLEGHRRLIHRAARGHLEKQITESAGRHRHRLGAATGAEESAYGLDLGVVGVIEQGRALGAAVVLRHGERERLDLLRLCLHHRLDGGGGGGGRGGGCGGVELGLRLGLGLLLLDVGPGLLLRLGLGGAGVGHRGRSRGIDGNESCFS